MKWWNSNGTGQFDVGVGEAEGEIRVVGALGGNSNICMDRHLIENIMWIRHICGLWGKKKMSLMVGENVYI